MKLRLLILTITLTTFFWSCTSSRKATTTTPTPQETKIKIPEPANYQASTTKMHDLIHTKLRVSFDWNKKQLLGEAEITLKSHFYPSKMLYLDAKGMEIKSVKLITGATKSELAYQYRNDSICITLDKNYSHRDTFSVYIDYISKPEDLPKGGSVAITDEKGLYFINADASDKTKPQQVWTQGETRSSSVWFPTIDHPNQKTTQEIYITVDTAFVTLSNGILVSSIVNNSNGTRTDYWKQSLPHAPYLFMMAVSRFAVVKDKWRNIEVNYYLEPEYEKYARKIFGNTPEMLEFYSKKLGVDYPWQKYSQVVVRDYVSGAMENTTATLHGEFFLQDDRSLLDGDNEETISHELFHHWFGDYVTCESFANLPLNESFATYGEYLWNEYKYGVDQADYALQNDLRTYLQEARNKQVNLIRFDYKKEMDMFDRHSYQKGGRVLHMLRKFTGDDAFFASLKLYLENNRFGAAEIHDLRLAFEKVTGEDLNWFFNEWFLDKGHPSLKIEYNYDSEKNKQIVKVQQLQSFETTPLFKLPVYIDIYTNEGVERKKVIVNRQTEVFEFPVKSKPVLVNFDAQKMLLCTKNDMHSNDEWIAMYKNAPLYMDRYEALSKLIKEYKEGTPEAEIVKKALNDAHWNIRSLAIKNSKTLLASNNGEVKKVLLNLAGRDPKSAVRNDALQILAENFNNDSDVNVVMNNALNDSSYQVLETAIEYRVENNPKEGLLLVKKMEAEKNDNIREIVSGVYMKYGSDEQFEYMTSSMKASTGYGKYSAVQNYGKFLLKCNTANAEKGIAEIADVGYNYSQWFVRLSASQALAEINKSYGKNKTDTTTPASNTVLNERAEIENELVRKKASELLTDIKAKETDPNLVRIYNKN
jgi:aminopeptidase N